MVGPKKLLEGFRWKFEEPKHHAHCDWKVNESISFSLKLQKLVTELEIMTELIYLLRSSSNILIMIPWQNGIKGLLRFCARQFKPGQFSDNIFFAGLPKIVEVHTTTGRRGMLWPADAGPERGRLIVVVWTWTIFGSPAKKTSWETDSKNGGIDWNRNEKRILFRNKNWAI